MLVWGWVVKSLNMILCSLEAAVGLRLESDMARFKC